jgi:hypothetical protein
MPLRVEEIDLVVIVGLNSIVNSISGRIGIDEKKSTIAASN